MPLATTQPTGNVFSQHLSRTGEDTPEESEILEEPEEAKAQNPRRRRRSLETLQKGMSSGRREELRSLGTREEKKAKRRNLQTRRRRSLKTIEKLSDAVTRTEETRSSSGAETEPSQETKPLHSRPENPSESVLKGAARSVAARRVSSPPRRPRKRPKSGSGSTPPRAQPKAKQQEPPQTPAQKQKGKGGVTQPLATAIHLAHWNGSRAAGEHEHDPNPNSIQKKKEKTKTKKKKKSKERERGRPESSSFDLFELMSDGDYDYDGEEEQEDDDEEADYFYVDGNHTKRRHTKGQSGQKEDSSSAEEGADFGAMVEDEVTAPPINSSEEEADTKNSMAKKKIRIRRRPVDTEEEYEDDDDDSGIGGFFRMLFYPVQVAMSRLMDGFGSPEEDEDKEPQGTTISKYPSYTLYHNAHSNEAFAEPENAQEEEEEDDEESSSLGSWLSSWFGLQRRTKKIGSSSTTTTVVPLPTPSKEPPGWLESWFGFGKTTPTDEEEEPEDDYDSE